MSDRKGLSASVALGTLLIPLTAFAASVMVGDGKAADTETTDSVVAPVAFSVPEGVTPGDLEVACGSAGLDLVAGETDGSITGVQVAALDALREICTQEGMPLPGPNSEVAVQTVAQTDSGPTLTISQGSSYDDHGDDDHHDDDDLDEDYHDDDDHDEEDLN